MFDHLPGVFQLARIHRKQYKPETICLTQEEYMEYLQIWNDLPQFAQVMLLKQAISK
jgi:hypothetical protein